MIDQYQGGQPRNIVSLFIVGAQKSGTTALYAYLNSSSSIIIPKTKELHFFDNEDLAWHEPDYGILHDHFPATGLIGELQANQPIWGDATPIYMFWPNSMERIRAYNPEAKIVVCLRHPSYRAFSHWRMEYTRRRESLPFPLAISEYGRKRIDPRHLMSIRTYTYLERGFYFSQVTSIQRLFPAKNIAFVRSDNLIRNPVSLLAALSSFLGIHPDSYSLRRVPHLSPVVYDSNLRMTAYEKEYLDSLYRDDIIKTSHAIGLSLDDWLDPSYVEPVAIQDNDLAKSDLS